MRLVPAVRIQRHNRLILRVISWLSKSERHPSVCFPDTLCNCARPPPAAKASPLCRRPCDEDDGPRRVALWAVHVDLLQLPRHRLTRSAEAADHHPGSLRAVCQGSQLSDLRVFCRHSCWFLIACFRICKTIANHLMHCSMCGVWSELLVPRATYSLLAWFAAVATRSC